MQRLGQTYTKMCFLSGAPIQMSVLCFTCWGAARLPHVAGAPQKGLGGQAWH